jgi:hypothetical protein
MVIWRRDVDSDLCPIRGRFRDDTDDGVFMFGGGSVAVAVLARLARGRGGEGGFVGGGVFDGGEGVALGGGEGDVAGGCGDAFLGGGVDA